MPLNRAHGNMYEWVTHTHAHLGGECPHRCSYCYVDNPRFGRPERYQGKLRVIETEFHVEYGMDKTIFIDHMNDLWAEDVPAGVILKVLDHCAAWPFNKFVYQTKNPRRYQEWLAWMPQNVLLGTTIETNRDIPNAISIAPRPVGRYGAMERICRPKFVTVEPIMDFDVPVLGQWLTEIRPDFVNIGADSKGHGLPEPTADKVLALMDVLRAAGIEIRGKRNLGRIVGTQEG